MKIPRYLLLLLVMAMALLFVLPHDADAQSKTSQSLGSSVLGSLKWGMGHQKALDVLEKSMMEAYRAKASGMKDLSYADKLRKTTSDRIQTARKSYKELNQQNSGIMMVSVVGDEFMPDNGESVFTMRDDISTKYYFFLADRLYKIVIVYDATYINGKSFDRMVADTKEKYGAPFGDYFDNEKGYFVSSTWKDNEGTTLILQNKAHTYDTYIMVFVDDAVHKTVAEKHKSYVKAKSRGPAVNSDIDDLTSDDSSATSAGDNSVDDILGTKTKVDLKAGLSKEDLDIINGITTQEEIDKKNAKKKKRKKRRKKKKKKNYYKGDASLTIY